MTLDCIESATILRLAHADGSSLLLTMDEATTVPAIVPLPVAAF